MKKIAVERLIQGKITREGAGVKLFRYIGADRSNDYEPILLFDYFDSHDSLDFMAGFPPHPHRGFETITYLLHGTIAHEDNHGHKGVINGGDVQWMTAGKGIIHSEMPSATNNRLQGLQMWLNLPAKDKMIQPRYQELSGYELPIEQSNAGTSIKVIAGTTDQGTQSPITKIATQPLFFDIHLPAGTFVQQQIPTDFQSLLFVLSGSIILQEEEIPERVLAVLSAGQDLVLKATQDSHCLLIAAKKLHEPIARYGPFVMNTQEEVLQALDDFRNGRF
jgi:redox-sensitive bicupin YhaK (pirin superfamily)